MPRNAVKWWCVAAFVSGLALLCFSPTRPTYKELEAELIAAQHASPDSALNLAETLMQAYPSQCMPYQIAANIYTLKNEYAAAESILQSAIETCAAPPELHVRLAHFYQRVMPEKCDRKIAEMLNRPAARHSPVLSAKLLCAGGRRDQAIHVLENAPLTFETTIMLSRLYAEQNEHDHAVRRLMDIPDIHDLNRDQKTELLAAMLSLPAPFDRRQTGFCIDLMLETAMSHTGYMECRRHLSAKLEKLTSRDPDRHTAALLQAGLGQTELTDLRVWLSAIYLQKIERADAAYRILKGYNSNDARVLEEKARMMAVHGTDSHGIRESWQRLLTIMPGDMRIRLDYARILNQSDLVADSRQILAGMARENLPAALKQPYFSLCFDNDAALEDYAAIVKTWIQAGQIFEYGDFLLFKDIIFSRLPETDQHRQLLTALKTAWPGQRPENEAVDLLRLFIAEQLRDTDLFFASADAYLSRQTTGDARTINALVQNAINTALSSSPPGNTVDTGGSNPSQAVRFAAKWSAYLVEQHPDKSAYQANLVISDYLRGQIRNLKERCDNLMKGNEVKHRQLERVARMLFRIGRYELSADYYQKAMDLRPAILRYRLGHADCLIRLHRYQQAREIYFRMLTHPTTARTWDVETLLERLWVCYEKPGIVDEFIDLIETLKTHPALDPNTLREAVGTLLLNRGRFQAAEKQLAERLRNAPADESRYGVSLKLATCHAMQNDYDAAIRIYSECLRRYPDDALKTIDCLYNRAEMKRRKGDYQAAIKDWKRIAERFPTDELAAEAMLAAASVARDSLRDMPQARQLYAACLKLSKPNSPMARMVEEKMAAMSVPEFNKRQ